MVGINRYNDHNNSHLRLTTEQAVKELHEKEKTRVCLHWVS